ncbi:MAG: EAL domain-containing protein [Roseibium sp.]
MGKTLPSTAAKRGFNASTILIVLLFALVISTGFFAIVTTELVRTQVNERKYLVDATNAFTNTYSEERNKDNVVPAVFRRLAIEHLDMVKQSEADQRETPITMRMPGMPGLEIRTVEADTRIKNIISRIGMGDDRSVYEEHLIEDDRFIGRTIFPSIASNENCVSCHNELLGSTRYKLGDVMGAYVVESDLTQITYTNLAYALLTGGIALLGGILVVRREHSRAGRVITSLEGQVTAERDKREAEAYANFLSSHDALTGLSNRNMFRDRLDKEVKSYKTGRQSGTFVALIDLDDFKLVNDSMGHDAGDALLIEVGRRLNSLIDSKNGLTARFGGDEFAFLVQLGSRFTSADQLGEEIIQVMQKPVSFRELSIQIRCSVGVAALAEAPKKSSISLLKAADTALYSAKKLGKGRFRIFDAELRDCMVRRSELAAALPDAIRNGDICAAFQPQIDLNTGKYRGFEALARWTWHGQEIVPDRFIPIAEETGLIRELDLLVLRKAAEFAVKLEKSSKHTVRMSSNMSALNFRTAGLAQDILFILSETGLLPEQLTIEVTETVLMENWGEVHDVVETLRAQGIRAALDDFGTGYSSLSYLSQLQFEEIKIDRSFVVDLCEDSQKRALFSGIVDLSKGLGQTVIIEGIETEEQANFVVGKGAHIGQGFLFSKPLQEDIAADAFIENITYGNNYINLRKTA